MIHLLKKGGRAGIVLPDGYLTGEGVKQRVRQKLLADCRQPEIAESIKKGLMMKMLPGNELPGCSQKSLRD